MSSELQVLETRKQVLVARASMQRLRAAIHVETLRESSRWPRSALSVLSNRHARSLALAGGAYAMRRVGLGRLVRLAAVAFVAARLWRSYSASRSADLTG